MILTEGDGLHISADPNSPHFGEAIVQFRVGSRMFEKETRERYTGRDWCCA